MMTASPLLLEKYMIDCFIANAKLIELEQAQDRAEEHAHQKYHASSKHLNYLLRLYTLNF